MNLNRKSSPSSILTGTSLAPEKVSIVTERIVDCIGSVVPHQVAIFLNGPAPHVCSPNGFPTDHLTQIGKRLEDISGLFPEPTHPSDQITVTHHFSDGSRAFLLPLVHHSSIEAVLCLYNTGASDQELLPEYRTSLEPLCQLAAILIFTTRNSTVVAPSRSDSHEGVGTGGNSTMGQFASSLLRSVSHDFRTPITAVRGCARMLMDGRAGPISDIQREYVQMALDATDQLTAVVESVSRASNHIEQIDAQIVDIPELWQSVINDSRRRLAAKNVKLEQTIDETKGMVFGDLGALSKLLKGLMAHAIDRMEDRSELRVELRCRYEISLKLSMSETARHQGSDKEIDALREIVFLHGGQLGVRHGSDTGQIIVVTFPSYYNK